MAKPGENPRGRFRFATTGDPAIDSIVGRTARGNSSHRGSPLCYQPRRTPFFAAHAVCWITAVCWIMAIMHEKAMRKGCHCSGGRRHDPLLFRSIVR
jgi:hypothetical protein